MPVEVSKLLSILQKKGCTLFVFENAELATEARDKMKIEVEVVKPSQAGDFLRSKTDKFAVETGFAENTDEYNLWMHNIAIEITKMRVKGTVEKRDLVVIHAVQTLDELDKTINLLMTRVREWYGIHFPELDRLLEKHETFARLVVKLGDRNNFTIEKLEQEEIPKAKARTIARVAEKSMGADLSITDLKQIQTISRSLNTLYKVRRDLEGYLEPTMEEVAPNTKYLVGHLLGARLIAVAGGLTNLAKRPASTIQVLGAEKALFRSLRTGTRPPKHGMIFQHTMLHDAKRWQRGKIARALAGKLAIAARADAFGGRDIGSKLKADLDRRIAEIQKKYDKPPPRPALKSRHRTRTTRDRAKKRRKRKRGH
jgi:nucleolar protein 56